MKVGSFLFLSLISWTLSAQKPAWQKTVDELIGKRSSTWIRWYEQLHANPELSTLENKTATFLRQEMKAAGWEIVDGLGYQSFGAILRNGDGPVYWYRTDIDGLPLEEKTGLPFQSKARQTKDGKEFPVMHACGHDLHMTSWLALAEAMQALRKHWKGTLVFIAQSAEETAQGAKQLFASDAIKRLPKPTIQLAIHDHAELAVGQAGFCDGYAYAAVDMLNITMRGKGGHGAAPHQTIDPIVLSAQFIQAIQTITSRNLSNNDPAVVTVGAIQGGSVGNIIPDQVELKLTIRSYSTEALTTIFKRLEAIANGLAKAAGLDSSLYPHFNLLPMSIPPVYNDPALGNRLRASLQKRFGESSLATVKPQMVGEDFGVFGITHPDAPAYQIWMGTVGKNRPPDVRPGLHSPFFAPDAAEAIPAIVRLMVVALLEGDFVGLK
jgi:amidohydrolase